LRASLNGGRGPATVGLAAHKPAGEQQAGRRHILPAGWAAVLVGDDISV